MVLKNVHRGVEFNQNAWLKPYIDMNTDLKTKQKWFWKRFFQLIYVAIFRKIMENVRKDRDIKLFTTERRRNYLVSEQNYHTSKFFAKIY